MNCMSMCVRALVMALKHTPVAVLESVCSV